MEPKPSEEMLKTKPANIARIFRGFMDRASHGVESGIPSAGQTMQGSSSEETIRLELELSAAKKELGITDEDLGRLVSW